MIHTATHHRIHKPKDFLLQTSKDSYSCAKKKVYSKDNIHINSIHTKGIIHTLLGSKAHAT